MSKLEIEFDPIEIDLDDLKEDIENYIKKQVKKRIQAEYIGEKVDIELPQIKFPDIEKRLEKIEDFIEDLKGGWIKIPK